MNLCKSCNEEFEKTNPKKLYCSPSCASFEKNKKTRSNKGLKCFHCGNKEIPMDRKLKVRNEKGPYCSFKCKILNSITIDDDGCWIWNAGVDGDGKPVSTGEKSTRSAVRIAYEIFVGELSNDEIVFQPCKKKLCINPGDKMIMPSSEFRTLINKKPKKLKLKDIVEIKNIYENNNWSFVDIAKKFKVSDSYIRRIIANKAGYGVSSDNHVNFCGSDEDFEALMIELNENLT